MSADNRLDRFLSAERTLAELSSEVAALKSGNSGGTSGGGMEDRVARLERNVDQLISDVGDLRVASATLAERVAHLPSKGFIVTTNMTGLALISAIILFADKLRALIGG